MSSRSISAVAVIREAYAFTFTNLGAIVGLVWVPMLLVVVMGFFSSQHFWHDVIANGGNPAAMGPGLLMILGYLVSSLLLQAIAFVAVVQLALGSRTTPVMAHFAFGAPEWRMFGAMVSLTVFLMAAIMIGFSVIAAAASRLPAAMLLLPVLLVVLLMMVVRLFLLLPAVAVVDTAPVLRRSWQLSVGNSLRLLGVLLAILVPLWIAAQLLLELPPALHDLSPPSADLAHPEQQLLATAKLWLALLPYMWGVAFFLSPLSIGLFCGAGVAAWRSLKDEPQTEIIA